MTTAQPQPLFYKNILPLNKEKHGDLSLAEIGNYQYCAETNSLYIAAVEFGRAATEYPIVFVPAHDDSVFPAVLLGLADNENLYLDKKGQWLARYIPAYVRRYPFIIAKGAEDAPTFTVCVDMDYPGFNKKGKGARLFDDDGGESALLKQSIEFLKEYQGQVQLTGQFCRKLLELSILEPMKADVKPPDGKQFSLGGFMCVNHEKLRALDAATVNELFQTGQMELIHAHFVSLNNVSVLASRLRG